MQTWLKCGSHGLSQRVNAATLLPRAMEYATPATWRLAPITRSRSLFDVYSGFYSTSTLLQPVKAAPSQGWQPPPLTKHIPTEHGKDDYTSTTPQAQWSMPYHRPRYSFLSLKKEKRRIRENFKNTRIKSGSRPRSQVKDAKPPIFQNWLPRANTLREQPTQLQELSHTKSPHTINNSKYPTWSSKEEKKQSVRCRSRERET